MSRRMRVLLALSAAVLTLLILTFLWQTYGRAADRGWVVLEGYPMALIVAWGATFLCVLVMEGCLALPRHSKAIAFVLCAAVFLAVWYFFGFDESMGHDYSVLFLGQQAITLYRLYWYVLVVLFIVLLVFNGALFLNPVWRTRLLISAGIVLLVISLWLAFMYYDTATVWCAGSLTLWWRAALWRRERGSIRRMLEEKDPVAVFALISSFVVPMVIYGLYDTLTFVVY
jgi:hypothetical protein